MTLKIGIVGCKGRVGSILVQELLTGTWPDLSLAGGTVLPQDLGPSDFFITDKADDLFAKADAVIDFTSPTATRAHAELAAKHGKILVAGTTGLTLDDEAVLKAAAQKTRIVYAANMSIGVNALLALVEQLSSKLQSGWDIEIFESHHKHKVDAPSGTALALGHAAAKGRGVNLNDVMDPARHGHTGARHDGHIGFSVARGGDVVGEHTVYFYSEGERIEVSHIATNRALFARGALRAALMVKDKPNGLYSVRDLLGL